MHGVSVHDRPQLTRHEHAHNAHDVQERRRLKKEVQRVYIEADTPPVVELGQSKVAPQVLPKVQLLAVRPTADSATVGDAGVVGPEAAETG